MNITVKSRDNLVNFNYEEENFEFNFTLYFSTIKLNNDNIASIALACRPKESKEYCFNFEISSQLSQFFKSRYAINVISKTDNKSSIEYSKPVDSVPSATFIAFSGGVDSLALKLLFGDIFPSISIDYGGKFHREFLNFLSYDTTIIKSDIRDRKYINYKFNERNWYFGLAPLILLKDNFEPLAIIDGTLMESSPFWFNADHFHGGFKKYIPVLNPNCVTISPLSCITELQSTKLVYKLAQEAEFNNALYSSSEAGSFKRYRKEVWHDLVSGKMPRNKPANLKKHVFGSAHGQDIITLYLVYRLGATWALENFVDSLPPGADNLDMDFYEKVNANNLNCLDNSFRAIVEEKMIKAGLNFFNEKNYLDLIKVKDFIGNNNISSG